MEATNIRIEFTKKSLSEILNLVNSGVDLEDAWDQILGKGLTYNEFVSNLYDELRKLPTPPQL